MRSKLIPFIIAAGVVVSAGFAWLWHEEHRAERTLVLAAGSKVSESYAFANILANAVEKNQPRLKIRVIETFGSEENIELLADGTVQLALIDSNTQLDNGSGVVDFLFPTVYHLIARKDFGLNGIADLRGRIVGLPPEGDMSRILFERLLKHYGIDRYDVKIITVQPNEAAAYLAEDRLDAYFRVAALGSAHIQNILDHPRVELLPIDQAAALRLKSPALHPVIIPKGAYAGDKPSPAKDLPSVGIRTLLVAASSVDDDDVYDIVKILSEARHELKSLDPRMALIDSVSDPFDQGVPIHAGAAAFFRRDQPLFVVKYAETMGFLLSACVVLVSVFWQVKLMADRRAKNRADTYNAQIIALTERAQKVATARELDAVRDELMSIFKRVFHDLDEDRITPESIQAFTLVWYTAVQIAQARRATLPPDGPATETADVAHEKPVASTAMNDHLPPDRPPTTATAEPAS